MDETSRKKAGGNEALLREVNEAIERGLWPSDPNKVVRFRCECARLECNQTVELRLGEYETVRAHSRRFVLVEGHEWPDVEAVVERREGYILVEKLGAAAAVAEELDPRS